MAPRQCFAQITAIGLIPRAREGVGNISHKRTRTGETERDRARHWKAARQWSLGNKIVAVNMKIYHKETKFER
uniref:60S ribosomal protein L17 n=1 Tax=Ascaris lumbricoides TaxID=6252 RepID=A0A0M3IGT8_ASCLU